MSRRSEPAAVVARRRASTLIAPEERRRFGGGGVALFSEMLIVGMAVTAASLPVVTMVPALAGGVRHLTEHLSDRADSPRLLLLSIGRAIRGGWLFGLCSTAVIALLVLDIELGIEGLVPGGTPFVAASGVLLAGVALVVCRTAACWRPASGWRDAYRRARRLTLSDPVGSLYVLAGLLVAVTMVWMFRPMVVIAPGMLALALVAAERRRVRD